MGPYRAPAMNLRPRRSVRSGDAAPQERVAVFSIFATLSMLFFKQFGVGLAAAIRSTPPSFEPYSCRRP
jgi:hypothetical protein